MAVVTQGGIQYPDTPDGARPVWSTYRTLLGNKVEKMDSTVKGVERYSIKGVVNLLDKEDLEKEILDGPHFKENLDSYKERIKNFIVPINVNHSSHSIGKVTDLYIAPVEEVRKEFDLGSQYDESELVMFKGELYAQYGVDFSVIKDIQDGWLWGISLGGATTYFNFVEKEDENGEFVKEARYGVALYEISVTGWPAQNLATITDVDALAKALKRRAKAMGQELSQVYAEWQKKEKSLKENTSTIDLMSSESEEGGTMDRDQLLKMLEGETDPTLKEKAVEELVAKMAEMEKQLEESQAESEKLKTKLAEKAASEEEEEDTGTTQKSKPVTEADMKKYFVAWQEELEKKKAKEEAAAKQEKEFEEYKKDAEAWRTFKSSMEKNGGIASTPDVEEALGGLLGDSIEKSAEDKEADELAGLMMEGESVE